MGEVGAIFRWTPVKGLLPLLVPVVRRDSEEGLDHFLLRPVRIDPMESSYDNVLLLLRPARTDSEKFPDDRYRAFRGRVWRRESWGDSPMMGRYVVADGFGERGWVRMGGWL